jgi:4-hydroxy-tetrahydrodipicolinate synthase
MTVQEMTGNPPVANLTRGIHAYVVTPTDDAGHLARASHETVIERVLSSGCEGISVLGATGEYPYTSEALRAELIGETVNIVAGRGAVTAGVGGFTADEIVKQAVTARSLGVDGVIVLLQGFFPMSGKDQVGIFARLSREIDCPITLYMNPPLCNVSYGMDALLEIAESPRVVAIKDASGSLATFENAAEFAARGTSVFAATATPLTAAFLLGASGWMSGTATLLPDLCHRFFEACVRQDWGAAAALERRMNGALGAFRSAGPSVIKALLNAQGLDVGGPLGPSAGFSEGEAATVLRSIEDSILEEGS